MWSPEEGDKYTALFLYLLIHAMFIKFHLFIYLFIVFSFKND